MTFILGLHAYGRFDHRLAIGPIIFSHYDLLWLHEGQVTLHFPELARRVTLTAPSGILVMPNTSFSGAAVGRFATASVCHFSISEISDYPKLMEQGFLLSETAAQTDLQAQIRYAMRLSRTAQNDTPRRTRLLLSILDGFSATDAGPARPSSSRVATTWEIAKRNLPEMRSLADVAALIDLSESSFRAMHRLENQISAGAYLRDLRLLRSEELLTTTGFTLFEIAQQIGYSHAETFCTAFHKSRGMTPGAFRKSARPFA